MGGGRGWRPVSRFPYSIQNSTLLKRKKRQKKKGKSSRGHCDDRISRGKEIDISRERITRFPMDRRVFEKKKGTPGSRR